jgi:hypothetical protein
MTNAEKFKEVFNVEPDIDMLPLLCPDNIEFCEYCSEIDCHCNDWWKEEYHE